MNHKPKLSLRGPPNELDILYRISARVKQEEAEQAARREARLTGTVFAPEGRAEGNVFWLSPRYAFRMLEFEEFWRKGLELVNR